MWFEHETNKWVDATLRWEGLSFEASPSASKSIHSVVILISYSLKTVFADKVATLLEFH